MLEDTIENKQPETETDSSNALVRFVREPLITQEQTEDWSAKLTEYFRGMEKIRSHMVDATVKLLESEKDHIVLKALQQLNIWYQKEINHLYRAAHRARVPIDPERIRDVLGPRKLLKDIYARVRKGKAGGIGTQKQAQ